MKIIFTNEQAITAVTRYADYHHTPIKNNPHGFVCLRDYTSEHQQEWISSVHVWLEKVCEIGTAQGSCWWYSPITRLIVHNNPILKALFFAYAAGIYQVENKIEELYLLNCPKEVAEYLAELFPNTAIRIDCELRADQSIHHSLGKILQKSVKAFIFFLSSFANLYVGAYPRVRVVIYSRLLSIESFEEKGDHYFENLFEILTPAEKDSLLWLYDLGGKSQKMARSCLKNTKNYVFINRLITPLSYLKCIYFSIKFKRNSEVISKILPPLKFCGVQCVQVAKDLFKVDARGYTPLAEFISYYALKRVLANRNLKTIVYPYEEKPVERAILMACASISSELSTIGYAHALHHQGHAYLRQLAGKGYSHPRPKIFAVTGESAGLYLSNKFHIPTQCISVIGSSRFRLPRIRNSVRKPSQLLRVLLIIGLPHEIGLLANMADQAENIFNSCDVRLRKYPYSWAKEQEFEFQRLKGKIAGLAEDSRELSVQIDWCDVVIFCSSSAGLEAMLRGRPGVYCQLHDMALTNPLFEKEYSGQIIQCKTGRELKIALEKLTKMNTDDLRRYALECLRFAAGVYEPPSAARIRKLLGLSA